MATVKKYKRSTYAMIMVITLISVILIFYYTLQYVIKGKYIPLALEQAQRPFEQLSSSINASFSFLSLINHEVYINLALPPKSPIYNEEYNEFGLNRTNEDRTSILKGSLYGIGNFNTFPQEKKEHIFYAISWINILNKSISELFHIRHEHSTLLKDIIFYSDHNYRISFNKVELLHDKPFKKPFSLLHPVPNSRDFISNEEKTWFSQPYHDEHNNQIIAINHMFMIANNIGNYLILELDYNLICESIMKGRINNLGVISLRYSDENQDESLIATSPKSAITHLETDLKNKHYITFRENDHPTTEYFHMELQYHLTWLELFEITMTHSYLFMLICLFSGLIICFCLSFLDERTTHLKARQLDEMTGCYNRYGLEFSIKPKIINSLKQKFPISIIAIDGNGFKEINDTYGHFVGDLVICHIADSIKSICRHSDFLIRNGGDEFLLICLDSNHSNAINTIERLTLAIQEHNNSFPVMLNQKKVSVATGIAQLDENTTLEEAIKAADSEMYKNKILRKKRG